LGTNRRARASNRLLKKQPVKDVVARFHLVVGCVLVVAAAGCTDGGDRARSRVEVQTDVVLEPPAQLAEAPINVAITRIAVERTEFGSLRWVGRGRLSGTSDVEYSVLAKTRCKVDGKLATDVQYTNIDGGISNVGRLEEGKEFDFAVLGSRGNFDDLQGCEMKLMMMDRDDAVLHHTLSTRVCYADEAASIGRCLPALERYPKRFAVRDFAFDPGRRTYDVLVAIGQPMGAREAILAKVTCRGPDSRGVSARVGTWRGDRSWGLLAPGDAARESGIVPQEVFEGADACLFEFLRIDTPGAGVREYWETQSTVMGSVGHECWSATGDEGACESLGSHEPPEDGAESTLDQLSLSWNSPKNLEIRARVRVSGPGAAESSFSAHVGCSGLGGGDVELQSSAVPVALEPGDTIALRGSRSVPEPYCEVVVKAPSGRELGVGCIADYGPVPCGPPS
jgi:hypothetical protein